MGDVVGFRETVGCAVKVGKCVGLNVGTRVGSIVGFVVGALYCVTHKA